MKEQAIKFEELISKVTVHSDSDESMVRNILNSVKNVKPIIIVKNKPWKGK
tara:strand:- start:823 stop:975 length:153 start_codon:yes stop_codon:yes gene_type:complete